MVTVLVQNKIDLIDESTVANEDVEALVDRLKLKLFRTSVKENFNIDQGTFVCHHTVVNVILVSF